MTYAAAPAAEAEPQPPAAAILVALADPTRRAIFERVAAAPRSVSELAADMPVSRPAVSQHLRVLKDAGLVADRAAGSRRVYRMEPQGLADLRAYLDHFWDQALAAFKTSVEHPSKESR